MDWLQLSTEIPTRAGEASLKVSKMVKCPGKHIEERLYAPMSRVLDFSEEPQSWQTSNYSFFWSCCLFCEASMLVLQQEQCGTVQSQGDHTPE